MIYKEIILNVNVDKWLDENKINYRLYLNKSISRTVKDIKKLVIKKSNKMLKTKDKYPWFRVMINGEERYVIDNNNFNKFIEINKLNSNHIDILVNYPDGIGAGGLFGPNFKLEIRSSELSQLN